MSKTQVKITKSAEKEFGKAPKKIAEVAQKWVETVEKIGLEQTRKNGGKGLHDEPLTGKLKGLRSVRLNKAWRLYYSVEKGEPTIVTIERIDKHKY